MRQKLLFQFARSKTDVSGTIDLPNTSYSEDLAIAFILRAPEVSDERKALAEQVFEAVPCGVIVNVDFHDVIVCATTAWCFGRAS